MKRDTRKRKRPLSRRRSELRPAAVRLRLEQLEDRRLLSIGGASSEDGEDCPSPLWQAVEEAASAALDEQSLVEAGGVETLILDEGLLRATLADAPLEFTAEAAQSTPVISLPTPEGGFSRFTVVESPIMAPALAAEFPEIKSYAGQGIDDPTATVRFDLSPSGFHAYVLSPAGDYRVSPRSGEDPNRYKSNYRTDDYPAFARFCRAVDELISRPPTLVRGAAR